jgi:hypothetical protein
MIYFKKNAKKMQKSKTKILRVSKKRSPKIKENDENTSDEDIITNLKIDMLSEEEKFSDLELESTKSVDKEENDSIEQHSENEDLVLDDITDNGEENEKFNNNEISEVSESDDYIAGDSLDENDLEPGEDNKTLSESE